MKILAIGAHPDDIEIFMAGFLFACKKLNHEIDVMIATNGALGGKKISNLGLLHKKNTIFHLSMAEKINSNLAGRYYTAFEKNNIIIPMQKQIKQ